MYVANVVTDEMMNAAVEEYRRFKTAEDYYQRLNDSSDFRARLEAAYARDPSFFTVDAAGAHPNQITASVLPALPIVNGAPELDLAERERRIKSIPGAAFPS
jgi:hypothetical protein